MIHLQTDFVLLDVSVVAAEDPKQSAHHNSDDQNLVLWGLHFSLYDVEVDEVEEKGGEVVTQGAELANEDAEPDAFYMAAEVLL